MNKVMLAVMCGIGASAACGSNESTGNVGPVAGAEAVIDDFEDANTLSSAVVAGDVSGGQYLRVGITAPVCTSADPLASAEQCSFWIAPPVVAGADPNSGPVPIASLATPGRNGSAYALRLAGRMQGDLTTNQQWGGQIQFDLRPEAINGAGDFDNATPALDVSQYFGIKFWAKRGDTPGAVTGFSFGVPTPLTRTANWRLNCGGGNFEGQAYPSDPTVTHCNGHPGIDNVPLSDEWQEYTIAFWQLRSPTWANFGDTTPPSLDSDPENTPPRIYGLAFTLSPGWNKTGTFDMWIDDIRLVKKQ